jgi:hypothetical protein
MFSVLHTSLAFMCCYCTYIQKYCCKRQHTTITTLDRVSGKNKNVPCISFNFHSYYENRIFKFKFLYQRCEPFSLVSNLAQTGISVGIDDHRFKIWSQLIIQQFTKAYLSLMYASCCVYPLVTVSTQHYLTVIHIYV